MVSSFDFASNRVGGKAVGEQFGFLAGGFGEGELIAGRGESLALLLKDHDS
jgi:hypothetical protein